jgi:hypothetical protein
VRISPHLVRAPEEPVDGTMRGFYDRLLALLARPVFRDGRWHLLECVPAWEGNGSWDGFVAASWEADDSARHLVIVNLSPTQAQCYVRLPFPELNGRGIRLTDQMGAARYDRDGGDLFTRGLYLDVPAWGHHVFEVSRR